MITVNYRRQITDGVAPYSYEISSNLSCTTITPNVGTTATGALVFDVMYDTQNCLDTSILSVQGSDANGCEFDFTIIPTDACADLVVDDIAFEAPYTFSVNASRPGCTQGLTFEWIYDTTLFDLTSNSISAFTSELTLSPKDNVAQFPASSLIAVEVTDCYGCTSRKEYNFTFCQPQVSNLTTELYCVNGGSGNPVQMYRENVSLLPVVGCTGIAIDWSTISFSNPQPALIAFFPNGDGTVTIAADLSLQDTVQTVFYSVATEDGVRSNQGILRIRILNCNSGSSIFIESDVVSYDCGSAAGETVYFYVEDYIALSPGAEVDWSSFALLPVPVSLSPSITLEADINGDHRIAYELPDPLATDTFAWSICTTDGACADAAIFTILECTNGPTGVEDEACTVCGAEITIDVVANDTAGDSPIQPDTIIITTAPAVGSAFPQSDGTIIYTPPASYNGTTTFEYTVRDQFGNTTDPTLVTIEMVCAGTDAIVSVCQ